MMILGLCWRARLPPGRNRSARSAGRPCNGRRCNKLARAVDRRAVRQVPAVQQVHAQDGVAGADQGVVDGVVGRRAGEGLHVDKESSALTPLVANSLGAAPAGQRFDGVGVLHALVIAGVGIAPVVRQPGVVIQDLLFAHPAGVLVRVAFGIDVLEGRAHRLAHRQRRAALAGDQDQLAVLAFFLQAWVSS
jgi:hypothetical protein